MCVARCASLAPDGADLVAGDFLAYTFATADT
jgi:hypothetical protein